MLARGLAVVFAAAAPLSAQWAAAQPAADQPATAPSAPAAPRPGPAAFFAHYTADWKSINVGTSDLELRNDAESGRYLYIWTVTARGVFRIVYSNDVIQKSWFDLIDDHVRPVRYGAEDGTSMVQIDFDWAGARAQGIAENKPVDLKLAAGTQDILSIQVEVMQDLKNGGLPQTFRILDKNEIKEFQYSREGPARLRTALGELDTVVVASRRPGNDRVLRMWFAPSLGYVPVQAERSRGGKLEFAMRIKTLRQ